MEACEHLKSLSHDSIPMSKLEEKELDEYCQRLAIMDAKNDGKADGIKQRNIEIAKKSLEQGLDVDVISTITGLSIEEINNL